jgi:nitrate/nitrite transporter NarK
MATLKQKQISVLTMNTLAFAVNFAVWVMFSVIGIKIKAELNLKRNRIRPAGGDSDSDRLAGALPLGILTDRYGGRIVFFIQMLLVSIPTWLVSTPPSIGNTWCWACSSGWPAARSRSASPTPRPGSARSGKARRWAFSARATPVPR